MRVDERECITAAAVQKHYDEACVLQMPEMTFECGRICALIGANGSGKSTYARLLTGSITGLKKRKVQQILRFSGGCAGQRPVETGYLPQKPYAFRTSLEKNMLLASPDRERANQLMEAMQLKSISKKRADLLSGGECARMALGRLLMRTYDMLILDEPTAAMDIEMTLSAERLLKTYQRQTGCVILLITHSLQQARRFADTILFLHKGQPVEYGSAQKLLYEPESALLQQYLNYF